MKFNKYGRPDATFASQGLVLAPSTRSRTESSSGAAAQYIFYTMAAE